MERIYEQLKNNEITKLNLDNKNIVNINNLYDYFKYNNSLIKLELNDNQKKYR